MPPKAIIVKLKEIEMRDRKYAIAITVDRKTEEILDTVCNGNISKAVRTCAAFWDKHHNKPAPQVDDESVRESVGFLDD